MPRIAIALAMTLVTLPLGCSESPGTRNATSDAAPASGEAADARLDRARIDTCAGFTIEKAAEILGVAASALEAKTGWSNELRGQTCRYWSPESLIGPGLQFLLELEPNVAEATARLASLRRDAPAGDAAIRDAVGQAAPGKSVMVFENVGDEAMWDPLTAGVSLRVSNVVASIQASPSRSLAAQKAEDVIELERRIAVEVARGLRAR